MHRYAKTKRDYLDLVQIDRSRVSRELWDAYDSVYHDENHDYHADDSETVEYPVMRGGAGCAVKMDVRGVYATVYSVNENGTKHQTTIMQPDIPTTPEGLEKLMRSLKVGKKLGVKKHSTGLDYQEYECVLSADYYFSTKRVEALERTPSYEQTWMYVDRGLIVRFLEYVAMATATNPLVRLIDPKLTRDSIEILACDVFRGMANGFAMIPHHARYIPESPPNEEQKQTNVGNIKYIVPIFVDGLDTIYDLKPSHVDFLKTMESQIKDWIVRSHYLLVGGEIKPINRAHIRIYTLFPNQHYLYLHFIVDYRDPDSLYYTRIVDDVRMLLLADIFERLQYGINSMVKYYVKYYTPRSGILYRFAQTMIILTIGVLKTIMDRFDRDNKGRDMYDYVNSKMKEELDRGVDIHGGAQDRNSNDASTSLHDPRIPRGKPIRSLRQLNPIQSAQSLPAQSQPAQSQPAQSQPDPILPATKLITDSPRVQSQPDQIQPARKSIRSLSQLDPIQPAVNPIIESPRIQSQPDPMLLAKKPIIENQPDPILRDSTLGKNERKHSKRSERSNNSPSHLAYMRRHGKSPIPRDLEPRDLKPPDPIPRDLKPSDYICEVTGLLRNDDAVANMFDEKLKWLRSVDYIYVHYFWKHMLGRDTHYSFVTEYETLLQRCERKKQFITAPDGHKYVEISHNADSYVPYLIVKTAVAKGNIFDMVAKEPTRKAYDKLFYGLQNDVSKSMSKLIGERTVMGMIWDPARLNKSSKTSPEPNIPESDTYDHLDLLIQFDYRFKPPAITVVSMPVTPIKSLDKIRTIKITLLLKKPEFVCEPPKEPIKNMENIEWNCVEEQPDKVLDEVADNEDPMFETYDPKKHKIVELFQDYTSSDALRMFGFIYKVLSGAEAGTEYVANFIRQSPKNCEPIKCMVANIIEHVERFKKNVYEGGEGGVRMVQVGESEWFGRAPNTAKGQWTMEVHKIAERDWRLSQLPGYKGSSTYMELFFYSTTRGEFLTRETDLQKRHDEFVEAPIDMPGLNIFSFILYKYTDNNDLRRCIRSKLLDNMPEDWIYFNKDDPYIVIPDLSMQKEYRNTIQHGNAYRINRNNFDMVVWYVDYMIYLKALEMEYTNGRTVRDIISELKPGDDYPFIRNKITKFIKDENGNERYFPHSFKYASLIDLDRMHVFTKKYERAMQAKIDNVEDTMFSHDPLTMMSFIRIVLEKYLHNPIKSQGVLHLHLRAKEKHTKARHVRRSFYQSMTRRKVNDLDMVYKNILLFMNFYITKHMYYGD